MFSNQTMQNKVHILEKKNLLVCFDLFSERWQSTEIFAALKAVKRLLLSTTTFGMYKAPVQSVLSWWTESLKAVRPDKAVII